MNYRLHDLLDLSNVVRERRLSCTLMEVVDRIAWQTKNAMARTGAVQAFFSALDLLWTLWSAWGEGREDERRRERQDREDERRRKKPDREETKRNAAIEQLKTEMKTVRYVNQSDTFRISTPHAQQSSRAVQVNWSDWFREKTADPWPST